MVTLTPDRRESREQEFRVAIVAADGLTTTDRWVYTVLLTMADWGTAHLPDRFQPRSIAELARKCNVSARQVNYSIGHLGHLQRHLWIERERHLTDKGIGGRGHPTRYVLKHGTDCDCKARKDCTVSAGKLGSECTSNYAETPPVSAAQVPVPAGRARGRGSKEGEALTVEIAGQRFDAIRCAGCTAPVPVKFAVNGRHPGCDDTEASGES